MVNYSREKAEINRVSRHLMETLEKIREWPTYPDSDLRFLSDDSIISEKQAAEIFRKAFEIVGRQYAEKYNPE